MSDLLSFIISNTAKHEFSSRWISCSNDVITHVDCVIKRDVYSQKMYLCSEIRGISFFVLKISVTLVDLYQEKIYNRCYCMVIT